MKSLRDVTCGQNKMPLLAVMLETSSDPLGRPGVVALFRKRGVLVANFALF